MSKLKRQVLSLAPFVTNMKLSNDVAIYDYVYNKQNRSTLNVILMKLRLTDKYVQDFNNADSKSIYFFLMKRIVPTHYFCFDFIT
jgi:hypothetical protein